jgi:hypothetical protein
VAPQRSHRAAVDVDRAVTDPHWPGRAVSGRLRGCV